ncbi:MAG TPA: hypothetical protein VEH62_04450 [Gemmatimonadales bacterium]|nr:hypothetical protein [Gemmatimonadales bacterium]
MSSWSRAATAATLAATLGGWGLAALAPRDFTLGTFQDDAQYAVLAKAIRERHTYRDVNFPGDPPELKFAPGWPAVLALAWRPGAADTANLERLRVVNLVVAGPLAGAVAAAGVVAFGLAPALSAVAAVAAVATPTVMMWWTIPMSEPLCLAFLALTLLLAAAGRPRGAAVAAAVAVYVRSIAAPFLLALLVVEWRRSGWRRALWPAVIGIGLLLPWAAWIATHAADVPPALAKAGYGTYAAFYGQGLRAAPATMFFTVPVVNAPMVIRALAQALLGWHWAPRLAETALGLGLIALAALGSRKRPVLALALALYVLVVLFWPFPQEDRFVGSVWPLLLLAALAALPWARARVGLVAVAALAAAVAFGRGEGVRLHRLRSRGTLELLDSVRTRIPPGAVVATANPPLVYLRLGDRTVASWRERSYRWYRDGFWATAWGLGDDLWDVIRAYRPDYLIIERRGAEGRYAAGSLIRQCPGVLSETWSTPRGEFLFAVHADRPCAPVRTEP